jgi:hypothetical protein
MLAVVNKGAEAVAVELPPSMRAVGGTGRWVLEGPSLGAKDGVRFVKDEVQGMGVVREVARYSGVIFVAG